MLHLRLTTQGNRLAVLSILRQQIHLYTIRDDGTLLHLMTIGAQRAMAACTPSLRVVMYCRNALHLSLSLSWSARYPYMAR
jgi:hypothetical protein